MALHMPRRSYGASGLQVPMLGLGAGGLGDPGLSEAEVDRLLGLALDLGVNLIDTAPSYGASEARIGRHLRGRRGQAILSTKVGYGIPGVPDWTAEAVTAGVLRALGTFGVQQLDIVHLHSCPAEILERGEVTEALVRAVRAGQVRAAAYSGDGHALYLAQGCGAFAGVQATLSICDQHNAPTLALAERAGLGVIIKRPLANAPWRYEACPSRADEAEYWRRWRQMDLALHDESPASVALRFAAFQPFVSTILVGTTREAHLRSALQALGRGPLPGELATHVAQRWRTHGADWAPMT